VKWRELRAGLLAIAIACGLLDGCPLPSKGHALAWQFWVEPVRTVRDVVETPVAWLGAKAQVSQQWSLYQAPVSRRYRMWIDAHAEGSRESFQWIPLYIAGDPDDREDADVIEHARVWGTWDPTDVPALEYAAFARWELRRVLAHHPEYTTARMRQERIDIGIGERTPRGEFDFPQQVWRAKP
jgi:hypothetical protein